MNPRKNPIFIVAAILVVLMNCFLPFTPSAAAAEPITVAQAIANNNGNATVKGYIVAYTTSGPTYKFSQPFNEDTNFAIADSPDERDKSKILPVQLPSSFRSQFGLKTNPSNIGIVVTVTGTLTAYFGVPGLKTPTAVSFGDGSNDRETPPPAGTEGLKIHDIQGQNHASPYEGQNVKDVEGIVTRTQDANNFYMQSVTPDENPKTSEGILVYKPAHNLKAGDKVTVTGQVKEWVLDGYSDKLKTDLAVTEINAQNGAVTILETGLPLPKPVVIGKDVNPPSSVIDNDQFSQFDPEQDAIDFYESLEGMRVGVENPTAVGPQKYGEVPVITGREAGKPYTTPGGISITKDNFNPERLHLLFGNRDFVAKTGDVFEGTVTGVLSYSFQNFKVLTDEAALPPLSESSYKREVTTVKKNTDKLTVATYNMENYTAANAEKTNKIAESIVNNLNAPDILGLVEVQDNNGTGTGETDASKNYEALVEAIKANGGPAYDWTDIAPENNKDGGAPNGNIRVGFIYNPERVKLADGMKGTATQAVGYENGSLTLNPGRIEPSNPAFSSSRKPLAAEFEFNGEEVIVIANHFNSKGGDQPIFGKNQPPLLGSEAQRMEIAKTVNGFVDDVLRKNEEANIVVLGDLNDFEFSNPLHALKGDDLDNLVEKVPVPERFTYNYQGNSQVLDHLLVSKNLSEKAEVDIVHINSPFMEAHGRVSDHDPVLAQLDFNEGPFTLSVMHTNDSHANVEQYPKLVTAVNETRAAKPNSLLLDAGDVFSGTLYFNQYEGMADLEFLNGLGYDAMTFGNHEFDKDSQVLSNFISKMKFPMVSANVNITKDPVLGPLFDKTIAESAEGGKVYPAVVKNIDGEKVGIFGLTTEDTTFLASPSKDIVFENAADKAKETVRKLEEQGVDKIVALSHLGYSSDKELAGQVDGIDIIVGGHTHTKLEKPVLVEKAEPTVIVQANEYLKYLGVVDVTFNEEGVVTLSDGKLLDLSKFAEDPAAKARINELKAPLDELKSKVVGNSNVFLNGERGDIRTKETNLGNMIADAMVEKANESVPTKIGMQNGGGIRASIPAGDVSLGQVLTVMPFANQLVTLDLTGEEIWQALEHSVSEVERAQGKFMHVSGLKFSYDPSKPAYNRVWKVEVKTEDGYAPIDQAKHYHVATNAFVADGGDGFSVFKKAKDEGRIKELYVVDYEVISSYLSKNSPVSPKVEGRILTGEEPPQYTGWVEHNGEWYYYSDAGVRQFGWLELDGKKYYLNPAFDGARAEGWTEIEGNSYYFHPEKGVMATGFVIIEGKTYYFDEGTGIFKSVNDVLAGLDHSLENYKKSGEVSGPVASKLTNTLHQAEHQYSKGNTRIAINFLEKFKVEMHVKPGNVSKAAKQSMTAQTSLLLSMLKKGAQ
ncbi:5'-nucleotidase C-terminal domain-containing protein [Bacillus massilinigeriensis]|uniref:5'-nucleotidase C-terminal domain-containing protein n=1 Tax=Bacillus mediterraneensis TaxID=1805474 RepID=UPI0008F8A992|nr:5'-nucleotidase C-terminal domain-containing protein [Bacillus mediterraneensis]